MASAKNIAAINSRLKQNKKPDTIMAEASSVTPKGFNFDAVIKQRSEAQAEAATTPLTEAEKRTAKAKKDKLGNYSKLKASRRPDTILSANTTLGG